MTWKEFKDAVETAGVRDDESLWYIDASFPSEVAVSRDEACGVAIGD